MPAEFDCAITEVVVKIIPPSHKNFITTCLNDKYFFRTAQRTQKIFCLMPLVIQRDIL
jgi:hypothetical protein